MAVPKEISDSIPPSSNVNGKISSGESPPEHPFEVSEKNTRPQQQFTSYLKGWRLCFTNIALCLGLFLTSLEATVVSTSLVSITNDLHEFQKSSWVVNAYLLTFTAFLIIIAKASDVFGRKNVLLTCFVAFVIFSIACGVAQTLIQLMVFRALQGVGGGGVFSLVWVLLPETVSPQEYAQYASILAGVTAVSNLLGPILGGLINNHTTWRWIFYLKFAPVGAFAVGLILIALPRSFPHPPTASERSQRCLSLNFGRIDFLGALLLLASSVLLVSALEEGGTEYSWRSAVVLTLLIVSIVLWCCFLAWERFLSRQNTIREAVFPWRMATSRFSMSILGNTFCTGGVFISAIVNLPQRFQVVNKASSFGAGYRLLALTLSVPVASGLAGVFTQRLKIPPFYILISASLLQIIGLALMGTTSTIEKDVPAKGYGSQVVMGFGLGLSTSTSIMTTPWFFESRDLAVAMGSVGQFRYFGGCVGIAVCTNVLNNLVTSRLSSHLSGDQIADVLRLPSSILSLPPTGQSLVRKVYAEGYNQQMRALIAFAGAGLLATLLMWERKPRSASGRQS